MASVRKRVTSDGTATWHAQVRLLGFPSQTKTFERKSDAESWGAETERLMKSGRFQTAHESQRRTVSDLFDVFRKNYMRESRRKDYTQILAWWEERIGRYHLANVRGSIIQKHLAELAQAPTTLGPIRPVDDPDGPSRARKTRAPGTLIRYLAVLSRVFTVAVDKLEWLDKSPLKSVEKPPAAMTKIPRTLSPLEERALLLHAATSDNRALETIILIALRTGMRYAEIMRLRWADFQWLEDHALLTVKKAKNNRQRLVPLVRDAYVATRKLLGDRDPNSNALLFPGLDADKEAPVAIRTAWETCLRRAKIASFRFHDLRHSAASRFAALGYSLAQIGEVLGHVDHRSTLIYTHFLKGHSVAMAQHAADVAIVFSADMEKANLVSDKPSSESSG
jgi:integrase